MNNIARYKSLCKKLELDGMLLSSPISIFYASGYDTGQSFESQIGTISDPHGLLFIPQKGSPKFLADARYSDVTIEGIKTKIFSPKTKQSFLVFLLNEISIDSKQIGLEKRGLNYLEGSKLVRKLASRKITVKDISPEILNLRSVKSQDEINYIKKAQSITDKVFSQFLRLVKPGVTEAGLASKLDALLKTYKSSNSFSPIIAFGKNTSIPHYQPINIKLKKDDLILLDFGAKHEKYCSDMTRMIFVGKPDTKQLKTFEKVAKTLAKIEKLAVVDKSIKELVGGSYQELKNFKNNSFKYFHSLGHGVGLEIHESPGLYTKNKESLKLNQVIAIEPATYFPGEFGIRVEDLVITGQNNPQILTKTTNQPIILN